MNRGKKDTKPGVLIFSLFALKGLQGAFIRFRKEILSSAMEGTPKGVQKRYARLSNLLYGFSCHQLCLRFSPAKDVFFAQLLNAHGKVNSPTASTLFVLDRSDIFIYDCHSFDSSVRTE